MCDICFVVIKVVRLKIRKRDINHVQIRILLGENYLTVLIPDQRLFREKRNEQIDVVKRIKKMGDFEKRSYIVEALYGKIFEVRVMTVVFLVCCNLLALDYAV